MMNLPEWSRIVGGYMKESFVRLRIAKLNFTPTRVLAIATAPRPLGFQHSISEALRGAGQAAPVYSIGAAAHYISCSGSAP